MYTVHDVYMQETKKNPSTTIHPCATIQRFFIIIIFNCSFETNVSLFLGLYLNISLMFLSLIYPFPPPKKKKIKHTCKPDVTLHNIFMQIFIRCTGLQTRCRIYVSHLTCESDYQQNQAHGKALHLCLCERRPESKPFC